MSSDPKPACETNGSKVTIKEVAASAGVGIVTVSRALNGQKGVSPATRQNIQRIADELGYRPNRHARFLKLAANRSIAVVIKGMDNPLFAQILERLEKNIRAKEYLMDIVAVPHWSDELSEAVKVVDEDSMAGVVFLGARFQHRSADIEKLKVPFVVSTVSLKDSEHRDRYASVAIDDYGESCRVVEYLYAQGHRNIAVVGSDPLDNSMGSLRLEGYRDTLAKHGIVPAPKWIRSFDSYDDAPYSYENGYKMTRALLEECPEVTAVFAIADVLAIGALHAANEMGRSVPDQLSIFGFDGIPVGTYLNPPLSTVVQPIDEIAEVTCELLFSQIEGKPPRHVIVSGEIQEKGTVASLDAACVAQRKS